MKAYIEQRADPYILKKDGWYYFTASVPAFDRVVLRKARTLKELPDAVEKVVWMRHPDGPMSCNIWAPEIHFVDGKWYIYFAAAQADADERGCYDHRIYALENEGADPLEGRFAEAGRMDTGWESFSLDSTTVVYEGKRYFIWAQRDDAIPGNSNLYIAEMESAMKLRLPAVRLSIPEYDWECQGFLVNEGPSCLIHEGVLYVTYSASATDERYAMGLLTLQKGGNPLDAKAWKKSPVPVMVTEEQHGLFGPGHNSFTVDEEGNDLLVFHARPYPGFHGTALSDPNRHCFLRPVRYAQDGTPLFQEDA
ncbi:MAG: glycoside hydrolase family 43 protein [Clostridia bacterium]|nr:glycoside hydrolase family 43 protein [Clostridia bacterium]